MRFNKSAVLHMWCVCMCVCVCTCVYVCVHVCVCVRVTITKFNMQEEPVSA